MAQITLEMSKIGYEYVKKVYEGKLSRGEACDEIHAKSGMNEASAWALITIVLAMLEGKVYKRAFNNEANRYFLESIRKDYGEKAFRSALTAAQAHVDYFATLGKGNLNGLQQIIDELARN